MLSDGTYDFFAHLERSGALQGLNIWELRRHLDEHRLAEIMIPNLAAKGIVLSDATAQLSEEDRITVGEAFFTARMQMGEEAAARHIAAAATLQSLQTTCQQNHYPSRKEAMIDRWAKAFYEGNYVARKAEIEKAIGEKKTIGGNFNNEAGVSYVVGFRGLLKLLGGILTFLRLLENCRGMLYHCWELEDTPRRAQ